MQIWEDLILVRGTSCRGQNEDQPCIWICLERLNLSERNHLQKEDPVMHADLGGLDLSEWDQLQRTERRPSHAFGFARTWLILMVRVPHKLEA